MRADSRRKALPLLALAASLAGFTTTGPLATPHTVHHGRIAPVPAVAGHIQTARLSFPPTTADCQRLFGINCYSPPQFQQAYNLGPLWRGGVTRAGRTIVIVDAFGSPAIRTDLHVFDQQYGGAHPPLHIIPPPPAVPPFDAPNPGKRGWGRGT